MNSTSSRRPIPCIVLGTSTNAYGTVRALDRVGVPCIMLGEAPRGSEDIGSWMSSHARLPKKVLLAPGSDESEWLQAMLQLGRQLPRGCPVLPSSDAAVFLLARYAEQLQPYFRWTIPAPATLDLFMDKGKFHQFAMANGVSVPRTLEDPSLAELSLVVDDLSYPVFIKPTFRDERWDGRFSPAKGLEAKSPRQLLALFEVARSANVPLLVQETVPGLDSNLVFSHLYIRADGSLAGLWTGRKLRQHPIRFGTATLAEVEAIPAIAQASLLILRALDYRGYASVEFKRDDRDGSYRVLEVTAGRTWYNHLLGSVAGLNLEARWYEDLTGIPLPADEGTAREGTRWVDLYRDLLAIAEYRAAGSPEGKNGIFDYAKCNVSAHLNLRDPAPGVFVFSRIALSISRALRRSVRRDGANPDVLQKPNAEWRVLEGELDHNHFDLPLQSRSDWSRCINDKSWLLRHRDAGGRAAAVAVSTTRSRVLPAHVRWRAINMSDCYATSAGLSLLSQLREMALADSRVLSLTLEFVVRSTDARNAIQSHVAGLGFRAVLRPRSYPRTLIVDLLRSEQELLASFSATTRRELRHASDGGFEVRPVLDERYADRLNTISRDTFARSDGPWRPRPWASRIRLAREAPDRSRIVGLFLSGQDSPDSLMAFAWSCRHGRFAQYDDAGSVRVSAMRSSLSYALMWDLIKWANAIGCEWFDLGGVTAPGANDALEGISSFKRRFSKVEAEVGMEWIYEPHRAKAALVRSFRRLGRAVGIDVAGPD